MFYTARSQQWTVLPLLCLPCLSGKDDASAAPSLALAHRHLSLDRSIIMGDRGNRTLPRGQATRPCSGRLIPSKPSCSVCNLCPRHQLRPYVRPYRIYPYGIFMSKLMPCHRAGEIFDIPPSVDNSAGEGGKGWILFTIRTMERSMNAIE